MRIGIAYPEYSRRGGIERASAELAEHAAAAGHDVHFFTVKVDPRETPRITFHKVSVLPFPNSALVASFAFNAKRAMERSGLDISHSSGGVVGCDVITAQSCHIAGLRTNDDDADEVRGEGANWGIMDQILLAIERKNYGARKYRHIVAVSRGVKQEILSCYGVPGEDVTVIPNGVDLHTFSPATLASKRRTARERWGFTNDEPVAVFVGNEFRRKGLRLVIEALGSLPDFPLKLLVAGRGKAAPYARYARDAGLGDRVVFAGSCEDMSQVYAVADLFILPSAYEAFPLALLEAAASGLPILVTKVHGAVELIKDGQNGMFIPREAYPIADTISMLLHNRSLAERLGRAARESVADYSWDSVAARTFSVYEEVMRRKGAGVHT